MPPLELGMIEVRGGIVGHAEAIHHAPRAQVRRRCKCDDLGPAQLRKSVRERRSRSFGRIPLSPMLECEPPADLVRGRKGSFERNFLQGDNAGKWGAAAHLYHPPTVTIVCEFAANLSRRRLGTFARV